MESDALWMLSTDDGDELAGCCISATLRDYARLGIFGQTIQIYPQQNTVIAMQSFWPADAGSDYSGHRAAISTALRAALP